jgi:hypothetical protein
MSVMSESNGLTNMQTRVSSLLENIRKQFEPGGKWAAIEDIAEYERQMNELPTDERDLCREVTIYANIAQFFSQKEWTVPFHIRQDVREIASLAVSDRIARMREVNKALMEYLHDASPDPEFWM